MTSIVFNRVQKRYDDGKTVIHGLDLSVSAGELMVLVGPSGCGKSTVLRMVAGLEAVSGGEIRIGGRVVNDLPPGRRNVAMVFQNYALYPHMTVRRNLEFPLRMQKLPREEIARRVARTADMLGLADLLHRRPGSLSGGQRQRVAMGRAIVRDACAFLMDEPLSNLDARLRVQIRTEIATLQARLGVTTLYVTHDQVEAMTLGRRVAVMRAGRLEQAAPPRELYERPANVFVAGFIGSPGMNVLRAALSSEEGGIAVRLKGCRLPLPESLPDRCPNLDSRIGEEVLVGIRPEAITLADNDAADTLPAEVRAAESLGHETILHTAAEVSAVSAAPGDTVGALEAVPTLAVVVPGHHQFQPDDRLHLRIDPASLHFFTPDGKAIGWPRPGASTKSTE